MEMERDLELLIRARMSVKLPLVNTKTIVMCRLAAYNGPPVRLNRLLMEPEHSLLKQSWAPREMREAALNADGFGFGWYAADGMPATYANTSPMWSDANLDGLGRSLRANMWLANVRSATPGQSISHANTQPFKYDRILFLHNGYIRDFNTRRRPAFHAYLHPEIQAGIRGDTDSEYLFALLRQHLAEHDHDLKTALLACLKALPPLLDGGVALVNIVVSNGDQLVACRHAVNGGECPTLYEARDVPDLPDATLIASERFWDTKHWKPVPPHSFLVLGAGERGPL